jgi:hypothetical protein
LSLICGALKWLQDFRLRDQTDFLTSTENLTYHLKETCSSEMSISSKSEEVPDWVVEQTEQRQIRQTLENLESERRKRQDKELKYKRYREEEEQDLELADKRYGSVNQTKKSVQKESEDDLLEYYESEGEISHDR